VRLYDHLTVPSTKDLSVSAHPEGWLIVGVDEILIAQIIGGVPLVASALQEGFAPFDGEFPKERFVLSTGGFSHGLQTLLTLELIIWTMSGQRFVLEASKSPLQAAHAARS
jgi:hypothetical protein